MWIFVGLVLLAMPVFLPSAPSRNVIGAATVAMFLLAFPSSIFAIPIMMIVYAAFGIYPNSMDGLYLNLLFLFVLGLVQWFWIVPRVWPSGPTLQAIEFQMPEAQLGIPLPIPRQIFSGYDENGRTPVERIIDSDETAGTRSKI